MPGTSNLQTSSYTYASAGTYSVTLIATSSNGGQTQVSTSVTVVAPTPVAKISIHTVNNGDNTFDYSIYGDPSTVSSGSITSYSWDYVVKDNFGAVIQSGTVTGADHSAPSVPNNWSLSLTLTVTSDQGVTGSASAVIDPANSIFTGYTSVRNGATPTHHLFTISNNNISVYPNPTVANTIIKYNSDVAGTVYINVYSADGKLVQQTRGNASGYGLSNTVNINTGNLTEGHYSVIVINKNGQKVGSSKLVKVK